MSSKFFTLALHVALPVAIHATIDARLVDSQGSLSSVGLLQVSTDVGGFGSVCGANQASADVICRSMGFTSGTVSAAPCNFYGGSDLCGAPGSQVAMSDLNALDQSGHSRNAHGQPRQRSA